LAKDITALSTPLWSVESIWAFRQGHVAAVPEVANGVRKAECGTSEANAISPVVRVRSEPTAEAFVRAILDLIRFGIAIAAMIRMIATTISNSIRENPFAASSCYLLKDSIVTRAHLM